LSTGDHLYKSQSPPQPTGTDPEPLYGHAIVVAPSLSIWNSKVIVFDDNYQKIDLLSWFGSAEYLFRIEYQNAKDPDDKAQEIAVEMLQTQTPKVFGTQWRYQIQFAVFCKTLTHVEDGQTCSFIPDDKVTFI